jgi:hypothetical protein
MLKNSVPIPEYLLLSDAVFERGDDRVRTRAQALAQELDGLGVVSTYFMSLSDFARDTEREPEVEVTALARIREDLGIVLRTLPYLLRLKRPRFATRGLSAA